MPTPIFLEKNDFFFFFKNVVCRDFYPTGKYLRDRLLLMSVSKVFQSCRIDGKATMKGTKYEESYSQELNSAASEIRTQNPKLESANCSNLI